MMPLDRIETWYRNALHRLRGRLLKSYLTLHGCAIGKHLKCKRFPRIRTVPRANIRIGDNVTIGFDITLDIHPSGVLVIGDRVNLTQQILLNSRSRITIGDDCLIAENVSIRDGDHTYAARRPIAGQPIDSAPIAIGNGAWIGAFTMVLKGADIPEGAIIGAQSLVIQSSRLAPYRVYAGAPVKYLKTRRDYGDPIDAHADSDGHGLMRWPS